MMLRIVSPLIGLIFLARRTLRESMSSKLFLSAVCVSMLFWLTSCEAIIASALRGSHDWQMVQSVGGLALGEIYRDKSGTAVLPIRCNVSGVERVTIEPTTVNSGLVGEPPLVRVRGSTIYITLRTTVATSRNGSPACPPARLGKLPAGRYSVVYLDPHGPQHPLGSVQVPEWVK